MSIKFICIVLVIFFVNYSRSQRVTDQLIAEFRFQDGQLDHTNNGIDATDSIGTLLGNFQLGTLGSWLQDRVGIRLGAGTGYAAQTENNIFDLFKEVWNGNGGDITIEMWIDTEGFRSGVVTNTFMQASCMSSEVAENGIEIYPWTTCGNSINSALRNSHLTHIVMGWEDGGDSGDQIVYSSLDKASYTKVFGSDQLLLFLNQTHESMTLGGEPGTADTLDLGNIYLLAIYKKILTIGEVGQNYDFGLYNSAPLGQDYTFQVMEDAGTAMNFSECTSDFDGDALNITLKSLPYSPTIGRLQICEIGQINCANVTIGDEFDPSTHELIYWNIPDEPGASYTRFDYAPTDGDREGTTKTITVDVIPVNDPPKPKSTNVEFPSQLKTQIQLENDDPDLFDTFISYITQLPVNGTLYLFDNDAEYGPFSAGDLPLLVNNSQNRVLYKSNYPNLANSGKQFVLTDSFKFSTEDDKGLASLEDGTITINASNFLVVPVQTEPETLDEETLHLFTVPASDLSNDNSFPMERLITKLPVNGILFDSPEHVIKEEEGLPYATPSEFFYYLPNAQYAGTDSFSYILRKDKYLSIEYEFMFRIIDTPDPPKITVITPNVEVNLLKVAQGSLQVEDLDVTSEYEYTVELRVMEVPPRVSLSIPTSIQYKGQSLLDSLTFVKADGQDSPGDGKSDSFMRFKANYEQTKLALEEFYIYGNRVGTDIINVTIFDNKFDENKIINVKVKDPGDSEYEPRDWTILFVVGGVVAVALIAVGFGYKKWKKNDTSKQTAHLQF